MNREEAVKVIASVEGRLNEGEPEWLYDTSAALPDGAEILEIGCLFGKSSVALALPQVGRGRLTCVDCFRDDVHEKWLKNVTMANVKDTIELLRMRSFEAFQDYLLNVKFDFAFIDGAHDYNGVMFDLLQCIAVTKPGGIIAAHDFWPESPNGWEDVTIAWQKAKFMLVEHGRINSIVYGRIKQDSSSG